MYARDHSPVSLMVLVFSNQRRRLCADFKPTMEQESILTAIRSCKTSIMIKAYAGTAKTTTLVMLSKELPPLPTLALAFSTSICSELKKRMPASINVSTLNAEGYRAWRQKLGNQVKVTVEVDKIRRLTEHMVRQLYSSTQRSSRGLATTGSSDADLQVALGSAAWCNDRLRGQNDLPPPERDELLKLVVAAGKA
jgi:hypothetical protein